MGKVIKAIWPFIVAIGLASPASAKVVQANDNGFVTLATAEVRASPDAIWKALIHPELWWNKNHSWSGDARNFSMTVATGGCFCEALPNSGFVEHARIVFAKPSRMLRLSGALGPLQGEALSATLTVKIEPGKAGINTVSFEYVVGGYARMALSGMAAPVDSVIAEQHRRLVGLIENGRPD